MLLTDADFHALGSVSVTGFHGTPDPSPLGRSLLEADCAFFRHDIMNEYMKICVLLLVHLVELHDIS